MNDLFAQLYIDMAERLKEEVPELRWIDMDFGQLEHFEFRPEVSFPCALIDFPLSGYSNQSQLAQFGEFTVTVRLGFAPFSSSHQPAPEDVKKKALAYFAIEQKVFTALQGWQPLTPGDPEPGEPYVQPFIRTQAATEQRPGDGRALRVRLLQFTTAGEDYSAMPQYNKIAKPPLELDLMDED